MQMLPTDKIPTNDRKKKSEAEAPAASLAVAPSAPAQGAAGESASAPAGKKGSGKAAPKAGEAKKKAGKKGGKSVVDELKGEERRLAIKAVVRLQANARGRSARMQIADMVEYLKMIADVKKAVNKGKAAEPKGGKKPSPKPSPKGSPRAGSPKGPSKAAAPSAAPPRKAK